MLTICSGRPGLISSLSRLSRYSTDSPASRGRPLATELGGIVIPSRQEVLERDEARKRAEEEAKESRRLEARKKAEAYQADISYLENAPEKSLAGRLARAGPKAPAKLPPSREELEAITRRRREERLAREAERAKAFVRKSTPSPEMLKAISAARESPTPRPRVIQEPMTRSRISQGDPFANFTSKQSEESRHPRSEEVWQQGIPSQSRQEPPHQAAVSETEKKPGEAMEADNDDGSQFFQFSDLNEKLAKAVEEDKSRDGKKREIIETAPLSQRELEASLAAKRREARLLRKEKVFARDLPEDAAEAHPSLSAIRREALAASIAKRKELRLRRERREAEVLDIERDPEAYSLEKRRKEKRRAPDLRQTAVLSPETEEDFDISLEGEVTGLPQFTGPEPVSPTLSEIIGDSRPATVLSDLPSFGNYAKYLNPDLKFSTPPDELHPVHLARLTLSRRAELSLPQRKRAIDIITQAFQPRSSRPVARA